MRWQKHLGRVVAIKVIKRDGRTEEFDINKIIRAIQQAAIEVNNREAEDKAVDFVNAITFCLGDVNKVNVDDIHNTIEEYLMKQYPDVAKAYILYRQNRTDIREGKSKIMKAITEISKEMHKDNANTGNSAASKMYGIAEAANKEYVLSQLMSSIHAENHRKGKVYANDLGYYQMTFNCFFNPIGEMLRKGFDNGIGSIRPPKRIGSAVALVAIILQSSQNDMFGGQGIVNFDTDLAPYVKKEYEYWYDVSQICDENIDWCKSWAMKQTEEAVYQAMEAFVYNMNTMRSRSGAQVTFSSVNFGTDTSEYARMISRNLLKAYIAGLGNGENPMFPNLCFRLKDGVNMNEGEPNYDLFKLALECVGKRIQPRFVFADSPAYPKWQDAATMGCRTAVRSNINGSQSPNARGNLAFNNISLPYIALESPYLGDFYGNLDKTINQAIDQLLERYKIMCSLKVKDVPFVSQWYQGHEGLSENDSIEPMIKNGTLSVGFIGLAECLTQLFGRHHGEAKTAQNVGLEIVKYIRRKTDEATKKYGLNFSCFATPSESACYTLLKKARDKFGIVKGVTNKEFFTNSFHLPVDFHTDIQTKIDIEAPYHLLCNAGSIMYVELGSSPKFNIEGLEEVIKYMAKSGAVYGGANWEHDFCCDCHYQGTFDGKCPMCGSENIKRSAIITGYLSTVNKFNQGKVAELKSRVSHGGGSIETCRD